MTDSSTGSVFAVGRSARLARSAAGRSLLVVLTTAQVWVGQPALSLEGTRFPIARAGVDPIARAGVDQCPTPMIEDRCAAWVVFRDGLGSRDAASVAVSALPGEGVVVTGYITTEERGRDYLTVAYDRDGRTRWESQFDGPAHDNDQPVEVVVSPDGREVYVTGFSYGTDSSRDFVTIAYESATGEELWIARFDGPASLWDVPNAMVVSHSGDRVYAAGQTGGPGDSSDFVILAYDTAGLRRGELAWIKEYDAGFGGDIARSLAISPDDDALFVSGESDGGGSLDFATIALDSNTGEGLWLSRYDGEAGGVDMPASAEVLPEGDLVFITGTSEGLETNLDYATVAYDSATGERRWYSRYEGVGAGPDQPVELTTAPDGSSVFVTGTSFGVAWSLGQSAREIATIAYDADTGAARWSARYPLSTLWGVAVAAETSADGNLVYVAGQSHPALERDFTLVAYDATTGEESWVGRFDSPDEGSPTDLAVSSDGERVYLTGTDRSSGGSGGYDRYATAAFDV